MPHAVCAAPSEDPLSLVKEPAKLSDPHEDVRLAAIRKIGDQDNPAFVPELILALSRDPSSAVRIQLIETLTRGSYRSQDSFSAVSRAMLSDLNDKVRLAAAAGVMSFEGSKSAALIEQLLHNEVSETVRRTVTAQIATAPAQKDNPEVTALLGKVLSEDNSSAVRMAALQGIEARGDKRALATLKTVGDRDPDPSVRRQAKKLQKSLSTQKKAASPSSKKPAKEDVDAYEAVKGKDYCGGGNGWCQCEHGMFKPRPRCVSKEDCRHTFENTYRSLGYSCKWDGQDVELR